MPLRFAAPATTQAARLPALGRCLALGALLALTPRSASAQSSAEELLASGIERPAALGRYRAASASDVTALIAVYERPEAARFVRLRALSALAEAASGGQASAQAYLHELVRRADGKASGDALHPARSPQVLTRALRGFRTSPSVLTNQDFARCLASTHASVRQVAVELLAAEHSERASSMLRAHLAHEQSPRVLRAMSVTKTD